MNFVTKIHSSAYYIAVSNFNGESVRVKKNWAETRVPPSRLWVRGPRLRFAPPGPPRDAPHVGTGG